MWVDSQDHEVKFSRLQPQSSRANTLSAWDADLYLHKHKRPTSIWIEFQLEIVV